MSSTTKVRNAGGDGSPYVTEAVAASYDASRLDSIMEDAGLEPITFCLNIERRKVVAAAVQRALDAEGRGGRVVGTLHDSIPAANAAALRLAASGAHDPATCGHWADREGAVYDWRFAALSLEVGTQEWQDAAGLYVVVRTPQPRLEVAA